MLHSRDVMTGLRVLLRAAPRVVVLCAMLSCGDSGAPEQREPTGEYRLQAVNDQALPHVIATYLNGEYDEIADGTLRVLSRGRLIVTAVVDRRNGNGSLQRETFDTVTFPYKRSGDLVTLSFQDPDGSRADTLQLLTFGDNLAIRALSENYRRPTRPITLVNGALYVK